MDVSIVTVSLIFQVFKWCPAMEEVTPNSTTQVTVWLVNDCAQVDLSP